MHHSNVTNETKYVFFTAKYFIYILHIKVSATHFRLINQKINISFALWVLSSYPLFVNRILTPPPFTLQFLLCYGRLRKQCQNLQAHYTAFATIFTQSCEFQCLVRMSLQWKNFNECAPIIKFNLNLAWGLRKPDKIRPHMLLFLLWYSHKPRQIWSTFDIAMLWFSPAKMPHTLYTLRFSRVDWTIT